MAGNVCLCSSTEDIAVGNEYCGGIPVSIAMEWEMNFYILVSIGIDDVLGG